MATFPNYINPIQTLGLNIPVRSPIDDRLIVEDEDVLATLLDLPETDEKIAFLGAIYDSMVVQVKVTGRKFIWKESGSGLMPTGHTYPPYLTDDGGQNYANKTYNFVLFDNSVSIDKVFTSQTDDFIDVEDKFLPHKVLIDKEAVNVIMKSSVTGYQEMELPDRVESTATGIRIFFNPAPAINEAFKITIS